MVFQGRNRLSYQRAAVVGLHSHQLHPTIGKVEHLQRAREFQQPTNVLRHHLLGRNQNINRKGIRRKQIGLFQVSVGANTGDFARRAKQGVRHLTGDHVGLVGVGDRHQHVGIVGTGVTQYMGKRAMPEHGFYVDAILQFTQTLRVGINDGDIVFLTGEILCQRAPDLPCAKDNNLHICSLCRRLLLFA